MRGQQRTEGTGVSASGVGKQHLCGRFGMMGNESGEQRSVITLVEQVAADDQVEAAQRRVRSQPRCVAECDRCDSVEFGVPAQEFPGQRMMVAGGDVGAAPCEYQAGESEAAAEFE